jgi:AAA+ ATPase superfamily predicted ATPase
MKFYNRKQELGQILSFLNSKNPTLIIVKGLRRVGKTRLILEALSSKEYINLFIPKDKTPQLFLEEVAKEKGLPRFTQIYDLLKYLFEKYEYVFFDEFQNFYSLDKSVYSDIQKLFDELKWKNKKICILVTGSSYSLIQKIFYDYSKALYGRKDLEINLEELDQFTVLNILSDLGIKNLEEQIKFYLVFGGMPKFYELLEKIPKSSFREIIKLWYTQSKSVFEEGNSILISEFGNSYKSFFSILEAIAQSKTKLSEIASIFGNDSLRTNRYLDLARKQFNLVGRRTPITEDAGKSRRGSYFIKNKFLRFWFCFVKRYEAYYEQNRSSELSNIFDRDINTYLGREFEEFCRNLIPKIFPDRFESIGGQWGTMLSAPKENNQYEIDICALNNKSKEILFGECKWKEDVDQNQILAKLKKKSQEVSWNKDSRKESYVIFAKSFKYREADILSAGLNKETEVHLIDLKEMAKLL